ncbi:MAG: hypothetical protein SF066_07090 [Thermoanaerobaculia bacterium]|nr:hypothetical protein [Thermoanaerobaculia bacterium]
MNEPRLPDSWERLRVPAPPAALRDRITGAALPAARPVHRIPVWPLLWAASMAGLVAINLWLDSRHRHLVPLDAPPSLAELRRARVAEALELF